MLKKQPDEISKQDYTNQGSSAPTPPKRRRLVTSAISASAMIVTAANRPAWAGDLCTRSALNSANVSGEHTFKGCGRSSGMWRNKQDQWPADCSPQLSFTGIFGSWNYKGNILFENLTLGQVIMIEGSSDTNPGNIALHVVGAYVNAHAFPKFPSGLGYVYLPETVVDMFMAAANASSIAGTKDALRKLKNQFDAANNLYDATTVWP